jgi:two-component system, OmpR family, sensor histidine kinase QseC
VRQVSLTRRLLLWVWGALLLVWFGFVAVGYRMGVHEAGELTDGDLAGTAALMINLDLPRFVDPALSTGRAVLPALKNHDYQPSLSVLVWSADGQLLTRSGEAPPPPFSRHEGFADLQLGTPPVAWRSFSQWDAARSRQVMVLVNVDDRDDLAEDVASQLAGPGLWLLPIVALALGLAIWRGLRPLEALSRDVAELEVDKAERLSARHPYREFNSVVLSINRLVAQQQAALERERQLATEIAHELRTPLSSISLQAASLRKPLTDDGRDHALQQIGADALRAGHVVSQLLSLARASRADLQQQMVTLELSSFVAGVVASYAQSAWSSGHLLSVQGDDGVQVLAHPLLLELALRNLIDNALQHTPQGTSVGVQWAGEVEGRGAWLQVCDDGGARAAAQPPPSRSRERLGLGHKIIRRVMDIHGGQFSDVPLQPPPSAGADGPAFDRCFRLCFASASSGVPAGPPAAGKR